MDLGLGGRAVLVTGASRGIGFGIARALAAEGARVAISSRSADRIERAGEEIGARTYVFDSADLDAAAALVRRVEEDLGPLDVLVTNTGGPPGGDPLSFGRDQWKAAYRDLVLAPLALIDAAVPGMRERGFGRIVNVASTAVREPIGPLILSSSHRSATLAAFTTLAHRLAADGITLNTLLPGRIATDRLGEIHGSLDAAEAEAREQVPAGRLGRVEEIAAAGVFLCSVQAGYVTGVALPVDGGLMRSI